MGGGAVQGLIMDKHGEDAMTQARQPEGVQRSDAGAPAQPMHVLVDATVGTPQRAYQEGWNACADAMLTATGETRDQLAKRLVAEAAGLDAIKLPPHDPTTGIEAILGENFQADDKEAAWKTIKAYADIHARRAVLLAQADAGAAAAPSSTTEEGRILSQVCDLFHIGKLARTESTILTNVSNVIRLSRLLRAVERDLFPEPDLPDDEDDDPYKLASEALPVPNSWGAKDEADYVAQFRAALAARGAILASDEAVAAQPSGWISVEAEMPEPGVAVLLDIGSKTPIRAMWAAKHTVKAHEDAEPGWCDYDESTDAYYCPEGWYEWNEHEDVHWEVSATPRAWMRLPAQATDCLGDGLAGWIAVSDRLPGPMEFCDWLMPPTELKRERWILANECLVTASLPGKATHWRASTPLPPAPKE